MITKNPESAAANFTFDLPEPPPKNRTPPKDWKPFDDFRELSGEMALDFETDDPGIAAGLGSSWCRPGEGSVCGFSIAHESQRFYVGLNHDGGNSDPDKAWSWLRHHARKPDVTFVYANCIYDLGWMLREGIDPVNAPIDVQGDAALLDEQRGSYSLDSLLKDYLGRDKGTKGLFAAAREMGITNPYVAMKRMPTWKVDTYGIDDAVDTLELRRIFKPLLAAEDLLRVHELERQCYLVGRDLRWKGIRVNLERWSQVKVSFEKARADAIRFVLDTTGVAIEPNDNVAIAKALLHENPTLQVEYTSRGIPSIRAGVLDTMATPISKAVRKARQMDRAIGTFGEAYIEKFTGRDGRIHGDFHPLRKSRSEEEGGGLQGAGPGRWSSSTPNLQNIPRRDPDIGPAIRSCFEAEEGEEWLKADYSSQEPRLSVHFAHLARGYKDGRGRWHVPTQDSHARNPLPGAAEAVERYLADPEMSFHKYVGKAMGVGTSGPMYDAIKINNLALIYGMTGKTFCKNNGYPTKWIRKDGYRWIECGPHEDGIEVAGPEGQALLDKHEAAVPWGKALASICMDAAEVRGYTKTILGRRIRYKRRGMDGRLWDVHKALNNTVQGSAADQMKTAQVALRRAGYQTLVVVHDDGNFSKPKGEAGERMMKDIGEIMASAIKLSVPSLAEMKVGANWGAVG